MSDDGKEPRACDLCGLDVGAQPFTLRTGEKTLRFCCEGCKGIYQMLNNIEEVPEPTTTRHGGDA